MPILISKTYDIVTPESAEDGDIAESGFKFKDEPHSFRELVDLLRDHDQPSSWPATGGEYEWYSNHPDRDFITGDEETCSIHYSRKNPERNLKYWRWAAIAAGIIKGKK